VRRLRLRLEYDGSEFQGWQFQPGARTVQGELEAAFREVTQAEVRVIGAGRTDAGVHASGQVAHCDVASPLPRLELRRALNAVVGADLAVAELHEAPADFHARHDARGKVYRYRVLNRPVGSPARRRFTWHLRHPLDLDAIREAAQGLLGEHDFGAFRGAPGGAPQGEHTRRSLDRLDWERQGDEVHAIVEGRSFLRYMVRNLVGTLAEVGLGRRPAADVAEILASGDRARAGVRAPPQGLSLERVHYAAQSVESRADPEGCDGPPGA